MIHIIIPTTEQPHPFERISPKSGNCAKCGMGVTHKIHAATEPPGHPDAVAWRRKAADASWSELGDRIAAALDQMQRDYKAMGDEYEFARQKYIAVERSLADANNYIEGADGLKAQLASAKGWEKRHNERASKLQQQVDMVRQKTLREAANAECEGCREDWPYVPQPPNAMFPSQYHSAPGVNGRGSYPSQCHSLKIRALISPDTAEGGARDHS